MPSAPFAKRRLIATVSSTEKPRVALRRDRLHRDDVAAQHAQVVHFVNHVDQDRSAADLAAPRRVREIRVGLEEDRAAHDRDELPQPALVDQLAWRAP